ncbi:MAG: RcpC/CpaB family pilus assembly protein [Alphaproteobacteria bacterium]|nr:RcpC/CpaB family pilus assembly protein [Alphaproteobacteria bacterium]
MVKNKSPRFDQRKLTLLGIFVTINLLFLASQYKTIVEFFSTYNTVIIYITREKVHRAQPLSAQNISEKQIHIRDYKPQDLTKQDVKNIKDYVMVRKLDKGSILKKTDITLRDNHFIRHVIKNGYRSVLLNIAPNQMSRDLEGGWRVDVSLTENQNQGENKTKLILCAVKVLDVGVNPNPHSNNEPSHYIILEALPQDALTLLNAYKSGTLNFLAISEYENEEDGAQECREKEQFVTKVRRGLSQ